MTPKLLEHISKIRNKCVNDIITNDDGYKIFFPTDTMGYLTSFDLRIIADYIDELNKDWDTEVQSYFSKL